MSEINVLLGEFDPLVACGLATTLDADPRVVVCDGTGDCTGSSVNGGRHVVVVHSSYAPENAAAAFRSKAGVIVIAKQPTRPYGMMHLAAGISCLASNVSPGGVLDAVDLAARGGCIFISGDGGSVRREAQCPELLTRREIEVLVGLSTGECYAAIAVKLGIVEATVKKKARDLLRKLGAGRKRELTGLPTHWFLWR